MTTLVDSQRRNSGLRLGQEVPENSLTRDACEPGPGAPVQRRRCRLELRPRVPEETLKGSVRGGHSASAIKIGMRMDTPLPRDPTCGNAGGLGLLLVDDIVVAHGGSVDVHSSIGPEDNGTTIRLTIPAVPSGNRL